MSEDLEGYEKGSDEIIGADLSSADNDGHERNGEAEDSDQLCSLMEELSSDDSVSLNIYQMPKPGQPNRGFCFSVFVNDYSLGELLTKIRDECGGGEFEIIATRKKRKGILRRQRFSIVANNVPKKTEEKKESDSGLAMFAASIEKALSRQSEAMAVMLQKLADRSEAPIVDTFGGQKQMLDLMVSMREFLMPQGQPQAAPAQTGGLGAMLAQIKELKELKELVKEDGDSGDSSLSGVFSEMAKTLLPQLMAAGEAGQAATAKPAVQRRIAKPSGVGQAKEITTNQTKESREMFEMQEQIKRLVKAAERNSNPELYAELIVEEFTEDQIAGFVNDPLAFDKLAMFVPSAKLHREWFEQLRETIIKWIADASSAETDADGENADDDAAHGDTSRGSGNEGDIAGNVENGERG